MKKLMTLAALAVTALSLHSCGFMSYVANSIATNPSFSCKGDSENDGVYDGQSFQLMKMGTCNYAWEVSDPKQLILTVNGNDAVVTGNLTNHSVGTTVKITARNADDATVEAVENNCPVYVWELKVYDMADNPVADPSKLVRNNTYVIRMVRVGGSTGKPVFTPVNHLYRSMKISQTEDVHSLEYTCSNSAYTKVSQTALTYTFKTPAKAATCTFTAKLGSVSKKVAVGTK